MAKNFVITKKRKGRYVVLHPETTFKQVKNPITGKNLDITMSDLEKSMYKQTVEALSGGSNTVIFDSKGLPSVMSVIPRFNLSDVINGAPETPHPAFIVNGVVKDVIYVSKFQNITMDSLAYSVPFVEPRTTINFTDAKKACVDKGRGWHLMTNAEWQALALWADKNQTMPRGNNDYGRDFLVHHEKNAPATKGSDGRVFVGKTGTGPSAWTHNHDTDGIYDLNGNVWEWVDGLKTINGRIIHMHNNDFEASEAEWLATDSYFDDVDGLVINSVRNAQSGAPFKKIKEMSAVSGHATPVNFQHLGLLPHPTTTDSGYLYADLTGERFALRGGFYGSGIASSIHTLSLLSLRSRQEPGIGFRSVYIP